MVNSDNKNGKNLLVNPRWGYARGIHMALQSTREIGYKNVIIYIKKTASNLFN